MFFSTYRVNDVVLDYPYISVGWLRSHHVFARQNDGWITWAPAEVRVLDFTVLVANPVPAASILPRTCIPNIAHNKF